MAMVHDGLMRLIIADMCSVCNQPPLLFCVPTVLRCCHISRAMPAEPPLVSFSARAPFRCLYLQWLADQGPTTCAMVDSNAPMHNLAIFYTRCARARSGTCLGVCGALAHVRCVWCVYPCVGITLHLIPVWKPITAREGSRPKNHPHPHHTRCTIGH